MAILATQNQQDVASVHRATGGRDSTQQISSNTGHGLSNPSSANSGPSRWGPTTPNHGVVEQLQHLLQKDSKQEDRQRYLIVIKFHNEFSQVEIENLVSTALEAHDDFAGQVLAEILHSPMARRTLAKKFASEPTAVLRDLWRNGEAGYRFFVSLVLLRPDAWDSEDARTKAETAACGLLLAKMLERGVEQIQLALPLLAHLIAVDAAKLQHLVDFDALYTLFSTFSPTNPSKLRGQATLIIAKMHEVVPDRVEKELMHFVGQQMQTEKIDSLILACSVVSSLFPVMPSVTAKMLLQEGFLSSLMQLVDDSDNPKFHKASLELLSAACMDRACREAIKKQCGAWVWDGTVSSSHRDVQTTAAVVTAKIRADSQNGSTEGDELVGLLRGLVIGAAKSDNTMDEAIEALSYQSTQPAVKETITNDRPLLKKILSHLSSPTTPNMTTYAGLTLLSHLTRYPTLLTPEAHKLTELRAYADSSALPTTHALDKDGPVSARCKTLLDAGIAAVLVASAKKASPMLLTIISAITLALCKHPKHRGLMAQQGLLDTSIALASAVTDSLASTPAAKRNAALTVARILIPIDPALLFAKRPIEPVIGALKHLLQTPTTAEDTRSDEQYWRGYPVLSALQALANLATLQYSADPDRVITAIVATCWEDFDEQFQSTTPALRTAATELILNLSQGAAGLAKFAPFEGLGEIKGEKEAARHRLRILVAYFGDEDLKLRLAAGGALATILGASAHCVRGFVDTQYGMKYLQEGLTDPDEAMRMRAIVIMSALVQLLVHFDDGKRDDGDVDAAWRTQFTEVVRERLKPLAGKVEEAGVPEGSVEEWEEVRRVLDGLC